MTNRRLLAIEDADEFVDLLRRVLAPRGWHVVGLARLAEALMTLRKGERFDAVLIDLVLLDADASKTMAAIPEIARLARPARIVVATGLYPPPDCPEVDVVLAKGSEGILECLLAAIRPDSNTKDEAQTTG